MGGEGAKESWFSSLWGTSRKNGSQPEKAVIGILAFEVATLMSKITNLWNCLSDAQISRLKEDVINSPGIARLASNDEDQLIKLAFAEIIENLCYAAHSVTRLGRRCSNPVYHCLDQVFNNPLDNIIEWDGWEYKWKEMEKKVKKMERFIAVTSPLHQEMEVLVELEQSLRRMQYIPDMNQVKLLEFQQKVIWQRQEVKNLRGMSPWSRTYDYTVELLSRCLVTIIQRLKFLIGINHMKFSEGNKIDQHEAITGSLSKSHSFVQSSVHPPENHASIFYSGPLVRSSSLLGLPTRSKRTGKKQQRPKQQRWLSFLKSKHFPQSGPFKGCMISGSDPPVIERCMPTVCGPTSSNSILLSDVESSKGNSSCPWNGAFSSSSSILVSRCVFSNNPPSTLGRAALSLHFANIIILIEKLASSPHLIAPDARDDLYNMLTTRIRSMLRARLKLYAKSLVSTICDTALAADWSLAIGGILEWISPLAHNTVRWHSEQNYEKQQIVPRGSLLLVQTLYFANQSKTEAAIVLFLMGLNYQYRFGKEFSETGMLISRCNQATVDIHFIEML